MDDLIEDVYSLPYQYLRAPNLQLHRPEWLHLPSPMSVFVAILISYFLVCGGLIYDIIIDPPAMGSVPDGNGNVRPVAFMQRRMNGQFIVEGIAASFFFVLGGFGFIILENSKADDVFDDDENEDNKSDKDEKKKSSLSSQASLMSKSPHSYMSFSAPKFPKCSISETNIFLTTIGFMLVMISFAICWLFMLTKLPGYLQ